MPTLPKYVTDYPARPHRALHIGMFINRDTWNKFTPKQKRLHMKQAALMSAKMAIGNFIVTEEQGSQHRASRNKGVQMVEARRLDFERSRPNTRKRERARNIEIGKGFGLKDPGAIIDAYEKNVEKWRKISGTVGRDIDKARRCARQGNLFQVDLSKL